MAVSQKVQLDIVLRVQGLASLQNLQRGMQGMNRLAGEVQKNAEATTIQNYRQIKSWDVLRDHLSEVERKFDAVWRAGVHLHQLGNQLVGISRTIIETGIGLVETYGDYDLMLRRASVALNTNVEWQGKLDHAIQQTAIAIGLFDPVEVAEAYYIWGAAAGVVVDSQQELDSITNIVRKTMVATAMAGGQLETNLKGIFGITSVFNLAMEDAAEVIEVLALMTERTAADFGDLTQAFSYVGPLASSLGVTFEEVAQILGILADAGQRGSRAGRGLSMIFEGLANRSGPANEALTTLIERTHGVGASFDEVIFPKGEFIGMTGFINEMARAVDGLNDRERALHYSRAFTNNATRAFIPLIEEQIRLWHEQAEAGKELTSIMDEQKYAVDEAGVFFANMAEMATSSINSVVGSLKNAFFPVLQEVALQVWDMARPVVEALRDVAKEVDVWMEKNPDLVRLAATIIAVGAAALGIVGAFFLVAGSLTLLGAGIAYTLTTMGGMILAFTTLGSILGGVATAVMTNFGGLREAFENLANSIIGLVRRIGTQAGEFRFGFVQVIEGVAPHLEDAASKVADFVNTVAGWIDTLAQNEDFVRWAGRIAGALAILFAAFSLFRIISGIVSTALGVLWALGRLGALVKFIDGFALGIGRLVRALGLLTAVRGIVGFIGRITGISAALSTAGSGIGRFLPILLNLGRVVLRVFGIVGLAISLFTLAYETNLLGFRDFVNGIVQWLVTNVPQIINAISGWIQSAISTISGWIETVAGIVGPVLSAIWSPIQDLIDRGIPALMTRIGEFWAAVSPVFVSIAQVAVDVFTNQIVPAVQGVISKIGEFITFVVSNVEPFWAVFIEILKTIIAPLGDIGKMWEVLVFIVGTAVGLMFELIVTFVEMVIQTIGPWIESILKIVGIGFETIGRIIEGALDFIMGILKAVFGTIGRLWESFTALLRGDWDGFWRGIIAALLTFVDGILQAIGGLANMFIGAITGMLATVWEAITGFFAGVLRWFPQPIQDFVRFGGDLIKGLWEGITGFFGWLWGKISGFFGDIWNKILGFFGVSSPSRLFARLGENLVRGLWQGIQNLAGWVWNNINNWISDIWDNVITFWDNHSPSRRMMGLGNDIAKGLAIGIAHDRTALKAMDTFSDALASRAELGVAQINSTLDRESGFGFSITTENERTVRVEIDLTSSDGSVDRLTLEQLRQSIDTGLVAAVEKMAEVMNA